MLYLYTKMVSDLPMYRSDLLFQRCVPHELTGITFVAETSVSLITSVSKTSNVGACVHKMNYEHFVHTAAELVRKYASQIKS